MIRKAKITLEVVYSDKQSEHPTKWDWCTLTDGIANAVASEDLEPTDEDREQIDEDDMEG